MSQLVSISIVTFICYEHVRVVKVRNSKLHFVTFTKRLSYPWRIRKFFVLCVANKKGDSLAPARIIGPTIRYVCGALLEQHAHGLFLWNRWLSTFLFARFDIFKFEFFEFNTTGEEIFLCEKWLDTYCSWILSITIIAIENRIRQIIFILVV